MDGVPNVKAGKRVIGVDVPGDVDEMPCEVGMDFPATGLIGNGGSVAGGPARDAHVSEFSGLGAQAGFDVAQTCPAGESGKGHAPPLIRAGKCLDVAVTLASGDTAAEPAPWQVFHDPGESQAAGMHRILPRDGA